MTQNALDIVNTIFDSVWSLFNSWYIPGTHVTPAGFALFALFMVLVIRFVKRVFIGDNSGGGNTK